MRFNILSLVALLGATSVIAMPVVDEIPQLNGTVVDSDPAAAMALAKGCGTVVFTGADRLGQTLKGGNICTSTSREMSYYMVGNGCRCYFFKSVAFPHPYSLQILQTDMSIKDTWMQKGSPRLHRLGPQRQQGLLQRQQQPGPDQVVHVPVDGVLRVSSFDLVSVSCR